ncbi:putative glycoside hydrolase family 15 protein [Saccharothrix sp. Mg75]|uniref:putative glycoside hydrolase family 15 protein n=1 Tax=Saccharothrix sp. Mg75 TaxID=3445357 RepID=UPI003EE883E7
MPKGPLTPRPRRALGLLCAALLLLAPAGCTFGSATGQPGTRGDVPGDALAPPPKPLAPCAWWYGIGEPPSSMEIKFAALHYDLVVLNATETVALRRLKKLNPKVKVLVYKDFSSTRNYPGAVIGDVDAPLLPSGLGYMKTQREHPQWFAVDTEGQRIEWKGYPKHWQMTVWDPAYQKAWTDAVTAEVVREGWDGVLADNDFASLRYYSTALLKDTTTAVETDRTIREGLDVFLTTAGESLRKAGKMLIPNVSESHLTAGRWSAHSRYDGAMEENFGLRDTGTGELLTFKGNEFKELRAQAALGESWLLLVTHVKGAREERVGYATAALLASPHTCWNGASTADYRHPDWSPYQETPLGEAVETANRLLNGAWDRRFSGGYVAVNPTAAPAEVNPPEGYLNVDTDRPVPSTLELGPGDAVVLVKPPADDTSAPATTPTPTTFTPTATPPAATPDPTTPDPTATEPTAPDPTDPDPTAVDPTDPGTAPGPTTAPAGPTTPPPGATPPPT